MSLKINPKKALELTDSYLDEIEELSKCSYNEGKVKKLELKSQIEGFIKATFDDGEQKAKFLYNPYSKSNRTEIERRNDYLKSIQRIKNGLIGIQTEINVSIHQNGQMSDNSQDESTKTNKLNSNITQNFYGNVENLTYGDLINYKIDAKIFFQGLEELISESNDLEGKEKESLIKKIHKLSEDPYISGISSGLIVEGIKKILGF